jgi:hypothetical protein
MKSTGLGMPNVVGRIVGREKLLAIFGYWPSFHDAEVVWLNLDRGKNDERLGPTLETQVHAFETTKEVDEKGFYVLRHHVLVHFRFQDVVDLSLEGFNHQNALFGLEISDLTERQWEHIFFQVRFYSSHGMGPSFQCHAIEVVEVRPCDEKGIPMST